VIAHLPLLEHLDGEDVSRSERIRAVQQLPVLTDELRSLAEAKRAEKAAASAASAVVASEDDDSSPWCPEERVKIAQEVTAQKAEQEAKTDHMKVPQRDYEKEHRERLEQIREQEELEAREGTRVRARNEAKLEFSLDDEDGKGNVVLKVALPRFLDSSMIDIDCHPHYVRLVVRGKLFRLAWPEEVMVSGGKAVRSSATGELTVTMPKVHQSKRVQRAAMEERKAREAAEAEEARRRMEASGRVRFSDAPSKLADEFAAAASARLSGPVSVKGIVDERTLRRAGIERDDDDDDSAPELVPKSVRRLDELAAESASNPVETARSSKSDRLAAAGRVQGKKGRMWAGTGASKPKKRVVAVSGIIQELTGLDPELDTI
jgi:hypothetical protein